jgi:hypothetical protein
VSKTAASKKRKDSRPAAARSADKAIYAGFIMIGVFLTLLSFPLFDGQWRWPMLGYIALVALLINLHTFRAYLGRELAGWQKALARLPMRCVGYGTRGGKPLEAAHGQPDAKRMMLMTLVFSLVLIAALGWLLTVI